MDGVSTIKISEVRNDCHTPKRSKQEERQKKRQKKEEEEQYWDKKAKESQQKFLDELSDCGAVDDSTDLSFEHCESDSVKRKNNMVDIRDIAAVVIRCKISNYSAAAVVTMALIVFGVVTAETAHLIVSEKKIRDARERVYKEFCEERDRVAGSLVTGLYFDAKGVKCLTQKKIGDHKVKVLEREAQDQYVVTCEPQSKYLFTFTVTEEPTKKRTYAECATSKFLETAKERGVDLDRVEVFGADTENTNTGHAGGMLYYIERDLGRKVGTVQCLFHMNELPFRAIFKVLDGKSLSGNRWAGPVGKLLPYCSDDQKFPFNGDFEVLSDGGEAVEISPEVVASLSQDQKYLYEIYRMIKTGQYSPELMERTLGNLGAARWTTVMSHCGCLWVRKPNLPPTVVKKFRMIMKFVVDVSVEQWFAIKQNPLWTEAPQHYFNLLEKIRKWHNCQKNGEDCNILGKNKEGKCILQLALEESLSHNSYYFNSENILLHYITSENPSKRSFAVDCITAIRSRSDNPNLGSKDWRRPRKNPKFNMEATSLHEVLTMEQFTSEPSITCDIPTDTLQQYKGVALSVDKYPCHTQSVERCIKTMTAAGLLVSTEERRDGVILATQVCRDVAPTLKGKKELGNLFNMSSATYSDSLNQPPPLVSPSAGPSGVEEVLPLEV